MKWITREKVKVGRIACAWAISRFVDSDAEFEYLPREAVIPTAEREGATPFHVRGAQIAHRGRQTSFEVLIETYDLVGDPALALLARMVNGADTDNSTFNQPEGPGLRAITDGLGALGIGDAECVRRGAMVFDALYAYCQEKAGR
jgi:hypothetical protein